MICLISFHTVLFIISFVVLILMYKEVISLDIRLEIELFMIIGTTAFISFITLLIILLT